MNENCLFCKIAAGTLPATTVFSNEKIFAINDIQPAAPIHILLIPRKHVVSIADLAREDEGLAGDLILRAKQLAEQLGISDSGYRLVFNVRKHAGQAVDHLHLHLIGGKVLGHLA